MKSVVFADFFALDNNGRYRKSYDSDDGNINGVISGIGRIIRCFGIGSSIRGCIRSRIRLALIGRNGKFLGSGSGLTDLVIIAFGGNGKAVIDRALDRTALESIGRYCSVVVASTDFCAALCYQSIDTAY